MKKMAASLKTLFFLDKIMLAVDATTILIASLMLTGIIHQTWFAGEQCHIIRIVLLTP